MSNSLANAAPFPKHTQDSPKEQSIIETPQETEATRETTPGDQEGLAWVVVALNLLPAEAMIMKGRLESSNIPAIIQRESIGSVIGLTVGPLGSAKILVPETMAETAEAILADTFEPDGDEHWKE